MNFITKQIEKKLGVDLDGDGKIGSDHRGGHGQNGGIISQVEKATGVDFNGDGRIGNQSGHSSHYPPPGGHYGGAEYGYSSQPYHNDIGGTGGLMDQLEKATGMDLNGDGRVGGNSHYSAPGGQYGAPGYGYSSQPYHGGGGIADGVMNQLEKVTGMDLNGDGHVGGGSHYSPPGGQYGAPGYGYSSQPYHGGGGIAGGVMNQLEKATGMDLNGDGHVGGNSHFSPYHSAHNHGY